MKVPLSPSHLRIIAVVVFFCIAINVVLYTSAIFMPSTTTTTEQLADNHDDENGLGNDRISLKARVPRARWIASNARSAGKPKRQRVELPTEASLKSTHGNHDVSGSSDVGGHQAVKLRDEDESEPSSKEDDLLLEFSDEPASLLHDSPDEKLDSPKATAKADAKSEEDFDAEKVLRLFQGCLDDDDNLSVDCYNDGYEELCKLFQPLGTIFKFVTDDMTEKIDILRQYRRGPDGDCFFTVQSMVDYEVSQHLTVRKDKPSACRTLLRLHRALEFISALLAKVQDSDNSVKFSDEATDAYDKTLSKYHPWVMRKAVHVAMYAVPERRDLLARVKVKDTPEGMAEIAELISYLNRIYDVTQEVYAANDLLELP